MKTAINKHWDFLCLYFKYNSQSDIILLSIGVKPLFNKCRKQIKQKKKAKKSYGIKNYIFMIYKANTYFVIWNILQWYIGDNITLIFKIPLPSINKIYYY